MTKDTLIRVEQVSKKFCRNLKKSLWYGLKDIGGEIFNRKGQHFELRPEEFWALKEISFELRRGECLGLIGPNGAGKSTLLKLLNGLIKPDQGRISIRGRVGALIELGAGFNTILSGRENIYINAAVLGIKKRDIESRLEEIIEFSELREFIDMPVQNYSSGMKVRLGFSIATAMEPDVLLLDEVLAVGDVGFRAKCFQRIGHLLQNTAVVFVSHNMVQVSRICDRTILLDKGNNLFFGSTKNAIEKYTSSIIKNSKNVNQLVLDFRIKSFDCSILKSKIEYSQTLNIKLSFNSSEEIKTGLCLITLGISEIFYTQTDFTDKFKKIPQGELTISIDLGPVCLSRNEYNLSVTILDKSKKNTLVHSINCAKVEIMGKKGYGVTYQLPVIRLKKVKKTK
jgi:lipopolysaccharide transport system ATP-binding protein